MGSFRDFLDDLKQYDELKIIKEEIDWDLQASALCAMSQRVGGPAIQFNNVKDYPGVPLVGSIFCGPGFFYFPQQTRLMHGRIAIALDLDPHTHYDEVMEIVLERKKTGIRGIEVESGPCQEVVIEDVDLYKYPIPRLHNKDGGRYLTSHVVLIKDEETGWTNFGVYRLMLFGRNKLVQGIPTHLTTPRHSHLIIQKYHQKKKPAPFAIVIGAPPTMMMTACLNTPPMTDEYALVGGLGLRPLILVKAKLSDILVPADAEIILEGHIYPGQMEEEGPFASISRYSERKKGFVYQVELITQRNNPILPFVAEGAKPSDSMCLFSLLHSVDMIDLLRSFGVPAKWMTIPVETKLVLGVVALHRPQPVPGLPARAAHAVFGRSPFIRQMIFVDDDVDSQDFITSVLTDKVYKANFERNYRISARGEKPLGLTENHDFRSGLTSTVYIDATWRFDRRVETIPRRVNFEVCFPEDIKEKVVKIWNEELKLTPKAWRYKKQ